MLICPQCESPNPDHNKYCQDCGISLLQTTCHECGAKVNYIDEYCPNCNAFTARVRWAIFSFPLSITPPLDLSTPSPQETESTPPPLEEINQEIGEETGNAPLTSELEPQGTANGSEEPTAEPEQESSALNTTDLLNKILVDGEYLDTEKRYHLLSSERESLIAQCQISPEDQAPLIRVKVADTKPIQESRLNILLRELEELDQANLEKIPLLVKPYLILEQYGTIAPKVFDGWQDETKNVVLIEDRPNSSSFANYLKNDALSLPHILYLLKEMVRLWDDLAKYNCLASIFNLDNIYVDEDETICLKQLEYNAPTQEYTLAQLVEQWQSLLEHSDKHCQQFSKLLDKINHGVINTSRQLCEELETIARQEIEEESISLNSSDGAANDIETGDVSESDLITIVHHQDSSPLNYTSDGDDIPTIVLPMQLFSLTDSGVTDIGSQRDHNEDFFGLQTTTVSKANPVGRLIQARGLYIVCDGMGGHDAGEVASAMAVEKLQGYFHIHWQDDFPEEDIIKEAIFNANQAIYDVNLENSRSGSGRMGTTLVMAIVQDTKVAIAHVGDSRAYKFTRKGGLEQLTVDHEVGQREIQRGVEPEIAYGRPDAYQLTQALGPRSNDFIQPDINFLEVNEDTILLLCSDGLSDNDLLENHGEKYLSPLLRSGVNLDQELLTLIDFANQYNGHDNITAVAIKIKVKPNLDQMPPG